MSWDLVLRLGDRPDGPRGRGRAWVRRVLGDRAGASSPPGQGPHGLGRQPSWVHRFLDDSSEVVTGHHMVHAAVV